VSHCHASCERQYGQPSCILGFAEIPWGSTLERVKATHGPPREIEPEFEAAAYYYDDELIGLNVEKRFVIHQRYGLINGGYTTDVDEGAGGDAYAEIVTALIARYPESDTDFEDGGLQTQFTDPSGQACIQVGLDVETGRLWVGYNRPNMIEWMTRREQAERHKRTAEYRRKL
jgi:hypothetical protein